MMSRTSRELVCPDNSIIVSYRVQKPAHLTMIVCLPLIVNL